MATVKIKNSKQLKDILLEQYAASALKKTQKEIYDIIQESITEFYREYSPQRYHRQYKFLNSLVKTELVRKGGSISCEVKIDENYLNYPYSEQERFNPSLPATGLDVVKWANNEISGLGKHGGTVYTGNDKGFWDEAMESLGGDIGILALFKNNLKKRGLIK